jgi:pimeloyl-CoA synthetase
LNRLSNNKKFNNQIIILVTTTEEGRTKDGKIIDKEGIKDEKIIKGIEKIEMASLAEMGITKMVIVEIITTKIMEIGKEGICRVYVVKKKDIKGMIVHYGNNI